ncbi:hypothetical protein [Enterovirga rhinocerotis]|uniref:Formylmethanofuran dehydrogenase subunit E n=1 Tax=Enterovirga rhinocerotis TaxID=1339210 RepID=A0A4R7BN65_9HYPH|nr:hypothetical protein [Enterovirga rhinocerotis]TDR85367.1 formylmethanofuran dehydrogenase subunit E [Enterovirga rhinocerotis]
MTFPAFFDQAPTITLRDPLAAFLGSSEDGLMTYGYGDAVRLAGHSCPVVAGAYLLALNGLAWLYEDEMPERGGVEVHFRAEQDEGNIGVSASVVTLVTGAAAEAGFGGIGPTARFARRGLLTFGAPIEGFVAFRRRDTGKGVVLDINTESVPHAPGIASLMQRAVSGTADPSESATFSRLWQDRVRRMLLEHADDPKFIHVYDWVSRP